VATYCTYTSLQTLMQGVDFSLTSTLSLASLSIERAEREIDKYLSKRYDLSSSYFQTYTAVPPMVRALCTEMSVGYMYKFMSRGNLDSLNRSENFIKPVIENLEAIRDHAVDLLNTSGSAIPESANSSYRVQSNTTDYSDTFNEDSELDWAVDTDKLSDIADERD